MTRQLRRPVVWLPISAVLLLVVVWRSRLWKAGDRLAAVDPLQLILALVVGQAILVLWAVRSSGLLAAAGRPVGVPPLIPMTVFANTINNITPGSLGELVRLYLLRAHHDVEYRIGGAVILIERFGALGYLAVGAAIAWFVQVTGLSPVVAGLAFAALAAAPGIAYAVGIRPSAVVAAIPLGAIVGPVRWGSWIDALRRLDATIATILTHPGRLAQFAASSALIFAVSTAQLWFVGRAVGVDLPLLGAWGALGIATTAGALSLLPFGLGATDLVLVGLLGVLGVPAVAATEMAFGYRLVATLPFALEGVVAYAWLSASLPATGMSGAVRAAGAGLADDELAASAPGPTR